MSPHKSCLIICDGKTYPTAAQIEQFGGALGAYCRQWRILAQRVWCTAIKFTKERSC